jgi:2-oxoglutarate ferredoxin oxidoreductase subunit beta
VAEVIDELNIGDRVIGVPPAGCAVLAYNYFDLDMGEAPHGRGAAVATGIKRVLPDRIVFTYQGDGDIAAIGTAETIHAANRGERITVIFVNNGVYGMTGGQMAPTTLVGQDSTTTPGGRDVMRDGAPLDLSQMLAIARGSAFIERTAVNTPKNIRRTKKALTKAFKTQMAGLGFSLVEILSPCPTNWKLTPIDAAKRVEEVMMKIFPLGVIKDETGETSGENA